MPPLTAVTLLAKPPELVSKPASKPASTFVKPTQARCNPPCLPHRACDLQCLEYILLKDFVWIGPTLSLLTVVNVEGCSASSTFFFSLLLLVDSSPPPPRIYPDVEAPTPAYYNEEVGKGLGSKARKAETRHIRVVSEYL